MYKNTATAQNDEHQDDSDVINLKGDSKINCDGNCAKEITDNVIHCDSKKLTEDELSQSGISTQEIQSLFVFDKNRTETIFCDTGKIFILFDDSHLNIFFFVRLSVAGVYTKNRNFRLFLSCKAEKNNPLVLAKDNQFTLDVSSDKLEKAIFMDSLISNVELVLYSRIFIIYRTLFVSGLHA